MADKGWHKAVRAGDLMEGEIFPAPVGRHFVLVARLENGQPVAFSATCPHQGTDLSGASVWQGAIRCPRHQYLYDPAGGENIHPRQRFGTDRLWKTRPGYLPTYPVEERSGWIWVNEVPNPPPASWDPALEEPPPGAEEEDEEEEVDVGPPEQVKTVRVKAGGIFELRLPTNPLPGHSWDVKVVGRLLKVLNEELLAENPPRWKVRIATMGVGEDEITCAFRQPWDIEPSELRRYVVQIIGA